MNPTVITRFAPSPTGYFHAGSYRTALFAYIYAKQHLGKFILRIEDTDRERSKKEYEDNIMDSLKWLGLIHDEFYRQSDRGDIYKKYIQKFIDSGQAYVSKETPKEPGGRTEVIRFRNANKKVAFDDLIRGKVEFDTTELGDFVIAKTIDEPIFHLVNVVDDFEMKVTHVIRGEDHISNTARQILIYEALGAPIPLFAHIPLLLAADRSKLSKRNGAVPITEYRKKGYMPEAVINYLALLGWHPADDAEILSFADIIREFSLKRVQKSGAIFDEEKLKWFNRQYLQKLSDQQFIENAETFLPEWMGTKSGTLKRILPLLRDKISSFGEIQQLFGAGGELAFVSNMHEYPPGMLLWKKNPDKTAAKIHLTECKNILEKIKPENFTTEAVKNSVLPYAEIKGRGDVLWPLRVALTGQEKSPDPFVSASILGKDGSLERLDAAIKKCD
ncbi:MAG: glutamate--tRNA ligase [Candidatus Taylorbacteria bacterium]|nr:glutamate--tRNA ligase [Candidatus Taylorbacteria bacterium]